MKDFQLYKQSHGYSCGPAALMMVMAALGDDTLMNVRLEDSIWGDANLVESRATSSYGLALAALKRGHSAEVMTDSDRVAFADRLKRHLPEMDLKKLDREFRRAKEEARELGVRETRKHVGTQDIRRELDEGNLPMVLISTRLMWELRPIPHWVVATGMDQREVTIANPEHGRLERYRLKRFDKYLGYDGHTCMVCILD
ncbi:MAG: peptidase C39 family protein [Thermoplasmatota archaeon]